MVSSEDGCTSRMDGHPELSIQTQDLIDQHEEINYQTFFQKRTEEYHFALHLNPRACHCPSDNLLDKAPSMNIFAITFTVIVAHFLALLSPGPDFVIIVKSAIKNGGRKSIGVPAGIATANAIYIMLCLAGVSSILAKSIALLCVLKIAGGIFLIYLSIGALRAKKSSYKSLESIDPNESTLNTTFFREYLTGFASGILNPKNLLFYLSLFTVVLTKEVGLTYKIALGVWMTSIVFIWDAFIVFILSTNKVRRKFAKISYFIDKCTGVVIGLIGFSIVKSALEE